MKQRISNRFSVKSNADLFARRSGAWMLDSFLVGIFVAIIVVLGKLAWEAATASWALPSPPEFRILYGAIFPVVFFIVRVVAEARGEQTFGKSAFLLHVEPAWKVDSGATSFEAAQPEGTSELESGDDSWRGGWQAAVRNCYLLLMIFLLTDLEPIVRLFFGVLMIWVAVCRWHPFDWLAGKRVVVEKGRSER